MKRNRSGLNQRFPNLLRWFFVALSATILVACASLVPKDYLVGPGILTERLAKVFPLRQSIQNGMFSAQVEAPKLSFIPAQNRLGLSAAFSGSSLLSGEVKGGVELTSGVRYDVNERAVYLVDTRLEKIQIGENSKFAELLRPALNALLSAYVQHEPIYRVADDQLRFAGTAIDITGITVVENGIRLALKPKL